MKRLFAGLALLLAAWAMPLAAQELSPEARQFLASLHPRSGTVALPEAKATLELGDDYLFYGPDDARRIIVDAWGNPPEEGAGVLGLVLPAGTTPLSDAWGAIVTYEETGYVSDDDAAEADYGEILSQLQSATAEANSDRVAAGYPAMNVVGWAETPNYDKASHSVVWARNLSVAGQEVNSLNYDVRTLGRRGVLSMNLISAMPELGNVRLAARDFASHAHFDAGSRYEDFDSSVDEEAGYGIAGLVAAGVGVAAAKKLGLLAIFLKFLKPILIGLAVFFGAFWKKIKRLFGAKDPEPDADWQAYAEPQAGDAAPAERPAEVGPGAERPTEI
jgi:uncharacterized membrane-anchored protein